ncbi:MAG: phosphate/phosphite/phosphonate ABC transporter substrate-binding protein [Thiobacillus sp.]|nr:phosphate/phosphite/phosphonate ABC transporter substrate-binding protein [Thiobacillus sp.]
MTHPFLRRVLVLSAALALPLAAHATEYRMGIFAGSASKDNQTELKAMYQPLVDYLAKTTGDTIKPEISQSFNNVQRHLGNSRYSIFMGPPHVTAAAIEDGFEPVAKWNKPLFSVFIVPVNSSSKTIANLKGARLGIASREAVSGPLCINALNKAGLRADKDFASVYEGKYQDVMARQLAEGTLNAVCTGPGPWKEMNEQYPGKFRVVGESVRVPGFAFSIDSELSEKDKKKLTAALRGIGQHPEGLRALQAITGSAGGATDTLPTTSREYFAANLMVEENKRRYHQQIPK